MDNNPKFVLFKKLLIFGAEGVGKTTLTSVLESNNFTEEEPSNGGKYIYYLI